MVTTKTKTTTVKKPGVLGRAWNKIKSTGRSAMAALMGLSGLGKRGAGLPKAGTALAGRAGDT